MASMTPEFISTRVAATMLHVSHRTTVRLVERGELTPITRINLGRRDVFIFERSDVEALAKARAEKKAAK